MKKKNRMSWHTIFRSYCRYYYHITTVVTTVATRHGYNNIVTTVVATVVTTVVATVVIENRMPTHKIFFLMSDVRCRATIFFLNLIDFAHREVICRPFLFSSLYLISFHQGIQWYHQKFKKKYM